MIYLTFDSNIWIYSLDDSWRIENELDYLEPWVESGEVVLLLPEIILAEWNKHEQKQVEKRKDKLEQFFQMAEEILPSAFFAEYKSPNAQNEIISSQLQRVKSIIDKAEIIPVNQEIEKRVIECGIAKKAPMHEKNSTADAIIIYSLINYAESNQGNHYFFISGNTKDFFDKKFGNKEIHGDLKPDFDRLNIKAYTTLRQLNYELRTLYQLDVSPDFERKRKQRIQRKIKEKIYNPEYEKITADNESSFIQNLNMMDLILKELKPTKEQVIFVLALVDSDTAYERKFYENLDNAIWFQILKKKNVFDSTNNPSLIQVKDGFQIPYWEVLSYLEKLSLKIKDGNELQLVDELVFIITDVSGKPNDNYKTWYYFIKIITNLPNEKVTDEVLNFIPVWLMGRDNAISHTQELCQGLLPKFLNNNPAIRDVKKAELILDYLFQVEKAEGKQESRLIRKGNSFYSKLYLHFLSNAFTIGNLTPKIVKYCSSNFILELGRTIKKMLLDYPKGINLVVQDEVEEHEIRVFIDGEDLLIFSINENENINLIYTIHGFEDLTEDEIKNALVESLISQGISYTPIKDQSDAFERLKYALNNDLVSGLGFDAIGKLGDEYQDSENVLAVFSLIFRELLDEKARQNPKEALALLRIFCYDKKYRIPFYKRIALYVVDRNWKTTKSLFWELAKDSDALNLFSNYSYYKELYDLLKNNQKYLTVTEKKLLQKIVDRGEQNEANEQDKEHPEYWQLRWYSALKNTIPFKEKYISLSASLNTTSEYYENLGEITFSSGSVSPNSTEELLQKTNLEIVDLLLSFQPENGWEKPNISGLSDALGSAVETEPQKFVNEIQLYKNVSYLYVYRILNALSEAWKKQNNLDWNNILDFCLLYIQNERFYSGELQKSNDGWNATADWVAGAVARLLTDGMQNDKNAFDLKLLPIAKAILQILASNLKFEIFKETSINYPTYSLNSTAGKVLRALLDYSLRRARNLESDNKTQRWEDDVIAIFEETFKKGIIDGYILTGWHFEQFYFLNQSWSISQVKKNYHLEDKQWLAFISGFAFGKPPFNKNVYYLFYPHYERAIANNIHIDNGSDYGLIRHIIAFYFWKFEDLKSEGLLIKLIENAKPASILGLINFVSQQRNYPKNLDMEEASKFEEMILNLWKCIADKYENTQIEEEKEMLVALSRLLVFVPKLNEEYTALVLKSIIFFDRYFDSHNLIGKIAELKSKGNSIETAKNIGRILISIPSNIPFFEGDFSVIEELVAFLYEHEQNKVADDFCNKMVKQGNDFLIPLHKKYKA